MSATDELRRLLDDRGVEWRERQWGGKHSITTFWRARGVEWHYRENRFGEVRLRADGLAPEQAIEATLERGECRDLAETPKYGDKTRFECSACGYEYSAVGGFGCDYGDEPDFRYCPNCGRKVVDA